MIRARKTRTQFIFLGAAHDARDGCGKTFPICLLGLELPATASRQAVKTGALIVLGNAPLGCDPTLLDKPVQRRVERAFFYRELLVGELLNPFRDSVTVHLAMHQRLQDQHVEGALKELGVRCPHQFDAVRVQRRVKHTTKRAAGASSIQACNARGLRQQRAGFIRHAALNNRVNI